MMTGIMFPKAVSHLWVSHDTLLSPHRPHLLLDCFKCTCRTRQKTRAYTTDILYHTPHTQPGVDGGCSRFWRWSTMESTADWDNGDFGESSTSSIDFGESQSAVLPLYCTLTSHAITLPHSLSPYLYSTPLYSRSRVQRCRWRM